MHLKQMAGLSVSPIGLGLAALGRPGYINLGHGDDLAGKYSVGAMRDNAHRVLDRAWELGIRYYDTARSYGQGEEFLASWLKSNDRFSEATTGSKWGYAYTADWKVDSETHEIKEHSLEQLRRQWKESQEHLAPGPSLYQIHSATLESGVLSNQEVLDQLWKIKTSGVKIGLSTSGPGQSDVILKALEITSGSAKLFDTVQSTWNLLEQSAAEALKQAHDAGVGVIVKEALANGRLTNKNQDADFGDKFYLFELHQKQLNVSTDTLAIAAAMNQPWSDVVLSGATTVQQLESNVQAMVVSWDPAIERDLGFMKEPAQKYWQIRSQLPWN